MDESFETKLRHRAIHHADAIEALTVKLTNVLEGELKTVLDKALAAHSKGKAHVVEYQIHDALRILNREVARLTS